MHDVLQLADRQSGVGSEERVSRWNVQEAGSDRTPRLVFLHRRDAEEVLRKRVEVAKK